MDTPFLPDGSWADPLTKAERRELSRRLASYARSFGNAATRWRVGSDSRNAMYAIANEMGDLHMDVTERAIALQRENR